MSGKKYVSSQNRQNQLSLKYLPSLTFAASILLFIFYFKNAKELKVKKTLSCIKSVMKFFILS